MKINNKYFGEIEYAAEEKLRFSEGLFGFEEQKEFLPIPCEAGSDALICLQSLEDEDLSFVLLNPFLFFVDYDPKISETDRTAIGSPKDEDISYYVIGVIREQVGDSTVNLKCPVAIHPETRVARQVILETDAYEMRHPLSEFKEGTPC